MIGTGSASRRRRRAANGLINLSVVNSSSMGTFTRASTATYVANISDLVINISASNSSAQPGVTATRASTATYTQNV